LGGGQCLFCYGGKANLKKIEKALAIFRTIPIRFVDVELEKSLKIARERIVTVMMLTY